MTKLILNTDCNLYEMNGRAVYSSRQVAEDFKKRHDNVLQAYDDLLATAQKKEDEGDGVIALKSQVNKDDQITLQFMNENFFESKYKDARGKMSRQILMTRNGTSVLVFGFQGKKALNFKVQIMLRFDQMEQFILSLNAARLEHPAFTSAIMDAHEEPMHYHFSNEADMINRIVLGVPAKKYREENGIKKGESIRPYLSLEQIQAIELLQRVDIGLIIAFTDLQERKKILTQYFDRISLKKIA